MLLTILYWFRCCIFYDSNRGNSDLQVSDSNQYNIFGHANQLYVT